MATPIAIAGMEQATTAGLAVGNTANKYFDRTVGTAVTNFDLTSAAARTGNAGLILIASAGTAHCGFANSGNNGILGAAGTVVASFWFRFPSLPAANAIIWQDIGTAGGNDAFLRFVQASGIVRGEFGATTVNGPTISANTWYHADVLCQHDANPHVLKWRINSVDQADVKLAVATENVFVMGWGNDAGSQTSTLHVDDILVSLTAADYPLGPHKVVQLIPDTTATATQIGTADVTGRMQNNTTVDATFVSADILAAISEVPPLLSASSSGIGQDTIATTSAAEIPMTNYALSGEKVTGCRVEVCTWANSATAAANTMGVRAFNGLAETTLFAAAAYGGVNTTSPAWICKMYSGVTDQYTLSNLTVRIGYSGDVTPLPGAHAIYAEIAVKTDDIAYPATARHPGVTPARSQRFQISQDDWLNRVIPVVAGGPSGDAAVVQRSTTSSTGTRSGAGSGTVVARATTSSSGSKSVSASAQVITRAVVQATGNKTGIGIGSVVTRAITRAVGNKTGVGVGNVVTRAITQATGTKTGIGVGSVVDRIITQATTPVAGAIARVVQRSTTLSTGTAARAGAGAVVSRSTTQATGAKAATGAASSVARSIVRAVSGSVGRSGATTVYTRAITRGTGSTARTGQARVDQRSSSASTGSRSGAGAAQVVQRSITAVARVVINPLTDLRIRLRGREADETVAGTEAAPVHGGESRVGLLGREPPTVLSGHSPAPLTGEEEGTP